MDVVQGNKKISKYLNKIGGYFVFVAFGGVSIILWILSWFCWNKRVCCCKVYHNPTIQRLFWWISFIILCVVMASCISGIIITTRFGKYVKVTQCAYERIYYDSEYGQLKDSLPRWEGFNNNKLKLLESKKIVDNYNGRENAMSSSFLNINSNWTTDEKPYFSDNDNYKFRGKNYMPYINKITEILSKCREQGKNLFLDDNKLFYDFSNPDNLSSILGTFIYEVNKIKNSLIEKFEEMEESVLDLNQYSEFYSEQLNISINNYDLISKDLKNYQNGYLDDVEHYVKVAKGCGHILVMIYLCLLSFISFCGCIFLLVYSYLTNQGNLDLLMHIVWNSIKFFSFSFFIYGAVFGMLFNTLRDLINMNMFLFGPNLIANTTYLLPKEKSREFFYFCLTEEKAEFTDEIDSMLSENLDELYTSIGALSNLLKKDYDLKSHFQENYELYESNIRRLDDTSMSDEESFETDDSPDSYSTDIKLSVILPIEMLNYMINDINDSFTKFKENNKIEQSYQSQESLLKSLDCGFLKSDLNILYNSLYDLSVECRILCVLSCCIAFFGEVLVNFYLLSMYHYNKTEFKEGSLEFKASDKNKKIERIDDANSQNEFMDKSNPNNLKKFNKKLDLDFSS